MTNKTIVTKSVNLSLVQLSWPIFIEIFLQMMMGTVDQIMMSRYSQAAVAALANANQIVNIFIFLLTVMSTATTILIAQYLGAKNREKIEEVCTVSLFFNGVFSLAVTAFLFIWKDHIFAWLEVPLELIPDASIYISVMSSCIIFYGFYFSLVASFRGFSWMKTTMAVALGMNIFHVIANYAFIYGWGWIPSMGVEGLAWSGNISRILGFAALLYIFVTKLHIIPKWQYLRPFPWQTLRGILHIAVPSGGETLSYQLSQATIMRMVNIFGLTVITTKTYVYIIAMCCYVYTMALSAAAQVVVGFLIGADEEDVVSKKVWYAMFLSIAICGSMSLLFYTFSDAVFGFFTDDREVWALGKTILLIDIFLECCRGVNIVMVQCLQAAGDIFFPMSVGIISMWVTAVGMAYYLGMYLGWGLPGIWLGMMCDELLRAIIFVVRWLTGGWKNHKLIQTT